MVRRRRVAPGSSSIKDTVGSIRHKRQLIDPHANLGLLMRKYPRIEDVLFPLTIHSEFIYEDMDYTVEEFAEIVGTNLDDLIEDLTKICMER